MKKNLSNQYISNIFSEHPIASWSLDDNFHYLSIDKNYGSPVSIPIYSDQQEDSTFEDFFVTSGEQVWSQGITYDEISGPYESSQYSKMVLNTINETGTRKKKIGRLVESFTLNGENVDQDTILSLSALINIRNGSILPETSSIVMQNFGCFFAEKISESPEKYRVVAEKAITIDQAKYFDWYSPQVDYEALVVKDEVKIYYVGFFAEVTGPSELINGEEYNIFVNEYDVAKFADIGLTDGPGEAILSASSVPVLSSYLGSEVSNFGYIRSESYNNDDNFGYLLVHNPTDIIYSTPLCSNSRLPIVIGSESALTIHNPPQSIFDKATAIYPGKSFMHESGNGSSFTAEFWMQGQKELDLSDNAVNLSEKIIKVFGPIDNSISGLSSGVYIGSNNIYLKIGNKLRSHYIGMIDRPMLIQWGYDKSNHSLFVNGEEVLSIKYEDIDLVDLDGKDFIGFFANKLEKLKVSCLSIYPYKVNDVIAKRRFVYGQGTQSLETLAQSYSGTAITADFSKSLYYNTTSFPDSAKWESGFFSNLLLTKDNHLSFPNYKLPDLLFVSKKNSNGIDTSFIPTIDQYKGDMLDVIIAESSTDTYIPVSYFKTAFNVSEKEYSKYNAKIKYSDLYSYLRFNNFNFLSNKINSIMFDVDIFSSDQNDFILFNLSNSAGAYLEARSLDNVITLSFYDNKTKSSTVIDTMSPNESVRQVILYNIENIIEHIPSLKNTLSQFFSSRSELSLSLFGKENGSQFSGKIFAVGFNNNIYTDKIESKTFNSSGNIDPSLINTYSFSVETLDGGDSVIGAFSSGDVIIDGGNSLGENTLTVNGGSAGTNVSFEPTICNYTIKPTSSSFASNRFFDLDVACVGMWETYLPASTFHKKMQGIDGEEYYDTGSVQINFNAENLVEQYYNSPLTKDVDKSYFMNQYDSNNVKAKVSIVDSENYGNPKYSPPNKDIVYNILNGDRFDIDTEFSVFNDNVLHLPDYFEEGIHYLKISFEMQTYLGINIEPTVLKYLQISTLPNKDTTFQKFEIGSRFGNPAYVASKRGTDVSVPQMSNSTVSMFYDQYLFNSKNSGFSVYETINDSYLSNSEVFIPPPNQDFYIYNKNQNGLQFPVDRSSSLLKLTGLTLFATVNDYYPENTNAVIKILDGVEKRHIKVGELVLTDDNESLKINLVLEEIAKQFNQGVPGKTRWNLKAVDDRNYEYDFISFYQNGKKVNNPVLSPMEWSHIGIVFIGTYPSYGNESYLFVSNMFSVNNISFHELGKQAQDISLIRTWNQVLYNEDFTQYKTWNEWKYPDYPETDIESIWSSVLFLTSGASEFLDVARYYNALTSNNVIYSEDTIAKDAINLMDETSVSIFTDISWSNILKYPV